ncbi:AraC family transcriptional regulator [Flavivirga aquimarina]|uniref:AraC family transcriptional regulator n=1 Tax=Flavivirga aquimarina TaxID=2027862 RepID=A0ABT8W765_9FLAO|nr:AraC family transcriptional regulator [Flavivirga aquimarina]MDO5968919.1 AraC family transcriptional regulator [Flavivirga aquimarina]
MKLHLLDKTIFDNTSFSIGENSYAHFLKLWHYHPELELVVILKSTGTRFIGDSIEKFEEGEIILIGKNLPHKWLNDSNYFSKTSKLQAKAIAIHFAENFLGDIFNRAPEMNSISALIERASRGIRFIGVNKALKDKIINLNNNTAFNRTIKFIEILYELSNHKNYTLLASQGFISQSNKFTNKGLDKMYDYIFDNFKNDISAKNVAEVICMNPSAFSRFFKRIQRKTFSQYLAEIRIGYACKLLLEDKFNIAAVCYESGFDNISNFNRQFKRIMKTTPSSYIKEYNA